MNEGVAAFLIFGLFIFMFLILIWWTRADKKREMDQENDIRHEKQHIKSMKNAKAISCPYCGQPIIVFKDKITICEYCKAEVKQ